MRKRIKKYGNSHVIVFTSEDMSLYDLFEGDILDLDDAVKLVEGEDDLE